MTETLIIRTTTHAHTPAREDYKIALDAICGANGITLEDARSKGRFKPHVAARRECYSYLQGRGWSTTMIGKFFHRDHSTIVFAVAGEERRKAKNDRAMERHLEMRLKRRAMSSS